MIIVWGYMMSMHSEKILKGGCKKLLLEADTLMTESSMCGRLSFRDKNSTFQISLNKDFFFTLNINTRLVSKSNIQV